MHSAMQGGDSPLSPGMAEAGMRSAPSERGPRAQVDPWADWLGTQGAGQFQGQNVPLPESHADSSVGSTFGPVGQPVSGSGVPGGNVYLGQAAGNGMCGGLGPCGFSVPGGPSVQQPQSVVFGSGGCVGSGSAFSTTPHSAQGMHVRSRLKSAGKLWRCSIQVWFEMPRRPEG